jgi:NAD(P)H-dependent flavin oxidoreductase YrpB (nitropropane dioxygenase family)
MNKGSTVELAIAVYNAGGYPSLCSWTYNGKSDLMQHDLDIFVATTGSNRIHLSFELHEYPHTAVQEIVKSHSIPTIEIIYGDKNTFRPTNTEQELTAELLQLLEPIKALGTRVFKRIYDNVDQTMMDLHLLDGFCIKGAESAGFTSHTPVKEVFLRQRELTPTAMLIPYGGVGTAKQVKEYIDLGAEIVAVGTLLALSTESTISAETKLAAIQKQSKDLVQFKHVVGNVERKQSALQFDPYNGPDDANGTMGLLRGMRGKKDGHVYLGHGIDHVTELKTCQEIIQELSSCL